MKIGRTRIKIAQLLSKELSEFEGFPVTVDPEDLWIQQGEYRKATWDLAPWGAFVKYQRDGGKLMLAIHSWDTMTSCLKGITIIRPFHGSPTDREACATCFRLKPIKA